MLLDLDELTDEEVGIFENTRENIRYGNSLMEFYSTLVVHDNEHGSNFPNQLDDIIDVIAKTEFDQMVITLEEMSESSEKVQADFSLPMPEFEPKEGIE